MNTKSILAAVVTFALGCAAAPLIVPHLSAQQAANGARRWEHHSVGVRSIDAGTQVGMQMGAEGWEMVSANHGGGICFKRPL